MMMSLDHLVEVVHPENLLTFTSNYFSLLSGLTVFEALSENCSDSLTYRTYSVPWQSGQGHSWSAVETEGLGSNPSRAERAYVVAKHISEIFVE